MSRTKTQAKYTIASVALLDAYTDFMLSRQAMNCTPTTLVFYSHTAGAFLSWISEQNVISPEEVTARHVRQFIAGLADKGRKDTTLHANARAIRTLLRFWHAEGYLPAPVKFDMPKLEKKRLPVLTAEQLQQVVSACNVRDKAIVLFLSDSGLRREEAIKLNWGNVDIQTGRVTVKHGKGGKDRTAAIGATTRRALLKYRRTLKDASANAPLFQTQTGTRFGYHGFVEIFQRLTKKTGIYISPHALRRTWTILCLRAEMNPLHVQHLGGWEDLTMVDHYAQMEDEDLLKAHRAHSPIDNLPRK
jgi:site-specific recombinase XerD